MAAVHLSFNRVGFSYESAVPLFEDLTVDCGPGWTGLVGENGSGKTTLLRLAAGLLAPAAGTVGLSGGDGPVVYCAQRTDAPSGALESFFHADDHEARRLRGLFMLEDDFTGRWSTLSHGERKKAQVAAALWERPAALLLDEPTNHLDAASVDLLRDALRVFRGAGLIVSHDRALLDDLCRQCLFLRPPRAVLKPGGYSAGTRALGMEDEAAVRAREALEREAGRLRREAGRRRALKGKKESRADRKKAAAGDPAARGKRNLARVTGRDAVGGRLAAQLEGRLRQVREKAAAVETAARHATGVFVSGAVCPRPFLFSLEAGRIEFGNGRGLRHPLLAMRPTDRVALTGPNGAGKSTLVNRLLARLTLPAERVIVVPQEITLAESRAALAEALSLPGPEQGRLLSLVSRLGSRPTRFFATGEPSPGETRKLLLARGILREPWLIVMDEPTNHLDAVAVQSLGDALRDCPCGLLLVSHDRRFLEELTQVRWEIGEGEGAEAFELRIG